MTERISGVYRITCTVNNKVYIGRSNNIYRRWNYHVRSATAPKLRLDLDKYGIEKFTFDVLEECSNQKDLVEREAHYIDFFKSYKNEYGYNTLRESKRNNTGIVSKGYIEPFQVKLESGKRDKFKEVAERKGDTPSEVVREFIDQYIKENEHAENKNR